MNSTFETKGMSKCLSPMLVNMKDEQNSLICAANTIDASWYNGVWTRYTNAVITADHVPLEWRYDFNPETNPYVQERLAINSTYNAGAIMWEGKYVLMVRVEGNDRKSFFALAESTNGIDGFRFIGDPVLIPELTENPATNIYDMRLVHHEDGWVYGMYCVERPDEAANDSYCAEAQVAIARTKNLRDWERLPDLRTPSAQQRNCVVHPEFVDGRYLIYTRPQDGFVSTGKGGGLGYGFCDTMDAAVIHEEGILDPKVYHTVMDYKNGQGPAPIKTSEGWLHFAHAVRDTVSGNRYVLYCFLTDLKDPTKVIARPGGATLIPRADERLGDLHNVLFTNGVVVNEHQEVFLYYASCDTRLHVATSTVDRLLDYVLNSPPDPLNSYDCTQQRIELHMRNQQFLSQ